MSEDVRQVIDEIRRVLGSRAREWVAVPTNGEDDSWGIRERGEDVGLSVAQMVWKWDAQFIVAAPRLLQQAADLLAQQAQKDWRDDEECEFCDKPEGKDAHLVPCCTSCWNKLTIRADALAARVKELERLLEQKNDTRVDDSQYHPPSARPLATASENEPNP